MMALGFAYTHNVYKKALSVEGNEGGRCVRAMPPREYMNIRSAKMRAP